MKKILMVSVLGLTLTGCLTTNQEAGALLGGATGAILGNTVGKGNGRTAAIAGGAILGTIVGSQVGANMDRPQKVVVQQQSSNGSGECAHITNSGVRASCERGVSERNAQAQRDAERQAYECGRYGRCQ